MGRSRLVESSLAELSDGYILFFFQRLFNGAGLHIYSYPAFFGMAWGAFLGANICIAF